MANIISLRAASARFGRLALLAGVGLTLTACQTSSGYDASGELPNTKPMAKPNFPVRGEVPPAKPASSPPPAAAPPPAVAAAPKPSEAPPVTAGIVETKPLPPPPATVLATAPPPPLPVAPPVRPATMVMPASAPVAIPPPRPSATGRVEQASVANSSGSYTVKAGQGLDAASREVGVGRQALIELNDLKAPYTLNAGQKLKTPGAGGGKQATYIVAPGDTMFSIAKRFNSTPAEMADLNDIKTGEFIRPGQRLTLPRKYQAQAVTTAAAPPPPAPLARVVTPPPTRPTPVAVTPPPAPPSPSPAPAATAQSTTIARTTPVAQAPSATAPAGPVIERATASSQQVRAAGMGKFIWPVKGRVLSGFGPKTDGQRNDGINIAAPMNSSVHAAAAGEVIYAGDVLREYGNLVLIQHPDGFVTAYGHLAKVNVKMKDKVTQDQEIGQVGESGGVTQPQLHFETRYARSPADSPAPPVDPMLVLPSP